MSDPINEIFNGTPDGIDDEELSQMQAAEKQRLAEIKDDFDTAETEGQPSATTGAPQPTTQQKTTATAEPEAQ